MFWDLYTSDEIQYLLGDWSDLSPHTAGTACCSVQNKRDLGLRFLHIQHIIAAGR